MESNFFEKAIILIGLEKHKETDNRRTEVYRKKKFVSSCCLIRKAKGISLLA